ncbi:PREDICTED: centrosomal protein of 95 kDa-like [Branchiostoma belcheri]|uniref:Centrosomal protein of 95 kDa-like n=1 Tax=Branchiostoma belcheri TaxID=7741 RepID=A0A6P5AKU9_BRABE|nr:PREDICTED: centrosomal protein of 95 kDa-like [Branchiostoma belcheri]
MDSDSSSSVASGADEEWIELANSLLKKVHVLLRVRQLTDCDGHLLVSLYEGILGDKPPDCIVDPLTKEDHIHNVQSVIDSLALDYLHVNLSHITGEGVVSGDTESIRNLLEIFEGLFEYLAEEIESESEQEDELEGAPQDPYAFSRQGQSIITDVLDEELGTFHRTERPVPPATVSAAPAQDSLEEGSTDDLIELGDSRYVHRHSPPTKGSPVKPTSTRLDDTYSKPAATQPATVPSAVPVTSAYVPPLATTSVTPSTIPTPILPAVTTRPDDTSDLRRISTVPPSIAIPISVTRTPTAAHRDVSDIHTTLPSRRVPTYSDAVEAPVTSAATIPTDEPQPVDPYLRVSQGVAQPPLEEDRFPGQRLQTQPIRPPRDAGRDEETAPKRVHFMGDTGRTPTRKIAGMDRRSDEEEEDRRMGEDEEVLDHQRRLRQLEEFLERSREEVRRLMVREDEELSQHSDSAVDYETEETSQDTDTSSGVEGAYRRTDMLRAQRDPLRGLRAEQRKSPPRRRSPSPVSSPARRRVRFQDIDDALDGDATGRLGPIRRGLREESRGQHTKTKILDSIYRDEFENIATSELRKQAEIRRKSNQKDKIYRKATLQSPKQTKYRPGTKYRVPVSGGSSRLADDRNERRRKRSRSASPTTPGRVDNTMTVKDNDLLPVLMEEFPFLHVSPHTMANMWRRQMKQIEQITKMSEPVSKRTKTQKQFEDAKKRQETMLKILDKERQHQQRMKDLRERSKQQRQVQRAVQQKRQQSARARRYYDEYQVRMRAKMLKRKTREEQIFKKLFEEGLGIQKTRIRDLRQYAKEKRDHVAQRQQDELESMENYYRDQFSMLAETLTRERYELQIRDKAQAKVLEKMRRELRQKMEEEIKGLQEQLTRDEDDAYFRQLEADRLRRQLNFARYQTRL